MTRSGKKFTPSQVSTILLEERVVLHGGGTIGSPVLLQGLHAPARIFRRRQPAAVSSLVDLAFQSFQQDYRQVRATYLASVQAGTAVDADKSAFTQYTTQRVNLLAQQVTNSLLVYPKSATRGNRSDSALPLIILRI